MTKRDAGNRFNGRSPGGISLILTIPLRLSQGSRSTRELQLIEGTH